MQRPIGARMAKSNGGKQGRTRDESGVFLSFIHGTSLRKKFRCIFDHAFHALFALFFETELTIDVCFCGCLGGWLVL